MLNPVVRNCNITIHSNLFLLILWEWISMLEGENSQWSTICVKRWEQKGMKDIWGKQKKNVCNDVFLFKSNYTGIYSTDTFLKVGRRSKASHFLHWSCEHSPTTSHVTVGVKYLFLRLCSHFWWWGGSAAVVFDCAPNFQKNKWKSNRDKRTKLDRGLEESLRELCLIWWGG